jgi:hypothetical protein
MRWWHWWVAGVLGLVAVQVAVASSTATGGAIAGGLGFVGLVVWCGGEMRAVALARRRDFWFATFTERYAALDGPLREMATRAELTVADRLILERYLDLCSEEYAIWRNGGVAPEVWRCWCRSMLAILAQPAVEQLWGAGSEPTFSYGLTMASIRAGAEGKA